jgi:hypothetical protein
MKKNEYCIFNKQYSKSEYEVLCKRIVAHMQETNEWGRYFPLSISPFSYNCSVAQEYYPLTRQQALAAGASWYDFSAEIQHDKNSTISVPTYAGAVNCSATGKPFKITKQERDLCEMLGIFLPTKCPDVRRDERMNNVRRSLSNYV